MSPQPITILKLSTSLLALLLCTTAMDCPCEHDPPVCGDGVVDPGEACDDGNLDDNDGCLSSCALASCGDGHLYVGVEACDGVDLGGLRCGDLGLFPGDSLSCDATCNLDSSECTVAKATFLSEQTVVGGALGGVATADAICQSEADAANLGGTYLAWMSDSATSPTQRFTQANIPYRLINGDLVANDWADLTDGVLPVNARIAVTAAGMGVGGEQAGDCRVWTGTLANGTPDGSLHCGDWTNPAVAGAIGFWDSPNGGGACDSDVPSQWSGGDAANACDSARRLYCFQQ
ncbi:MAG: hypothetical protein KC636_14220 [Myxococcales bacterium]|nr:hypothetical protein [Myxococcales bacterium]